MNTKKASGSRPRKKPQQKKEKKDTQKKEQSLVPGQPRPEIQINNVNSLIQMAIKNKTGVDQLKELMRMKYEHEEREASKRYHYNFCRMQSEFPVIKKTKSVKNDSGKILYRYAPLEMIINKIRPFLKAYGFSYSWSEEFVKEGWKRIHCHITGHGHSESAYADIPIMNSTKMTNNIQQSGSASTYGKRYSLIGKLGIMVEDDDDGASVQNKQDQQTDYKKPMAEWGDEENKIWSTIISQCRILGITGKGLKERFKIERLDYLKLADLKKIEKELKGEINELDKQQ